jgi:translation initiation factor 2 alpha subunit (eIF-2alpha)
MSLTNCRFYEEKYPEIDSFVMVNVKQVRDLAQEFPEGSC